MVQINNVPALVQLMVGAEQTHACVTRPWCVNMIREYDGNIDTKNTTSRIKYCTYLQIIVFTMEMNVIFIIWRNGAASYALLAVVCSCV